MIAFIVIGKAAIFASAATGRLARLSARLPLAALGNIIAPSGSKTLGTLLGAGGGALAGRAIDRNNVR